MVQEPVKCLADKSYMGLCYFTCQLPKGHPGPHEDYLDDKTIQWEDKGEVKVKKV